MEQLILSLERTKYPDNLFYGMSLYYNSMGIKGLIIGSLPDNYDTSKSKIIRLKYYK